MRKDKQLEKNFIESVEKGRFNFSYSSLNRMIFSPQLFYKDYILKDREIRTDKHLIEGKLLHLLLLQPEEFNKQFSMIPGKIPSEAVRRVLNEVKDNLPLPLNSGDPEVEQNWEWEKLSLLNKEINTALKHQNLYQSMKDEAKRVAKIQTTDNEDYYRFLCTSEGKDIVDQDMYDKALARVGIIRDNEPINALLTKETTDFEIDTVEIHNEAFLTCTLNDYNFGLKGFIDRYMIDHDKKTITIIDIKTTGKTITDFPETVEFYNYWMQSAIYINLVIKNVEKNVQNYEINFNFIVIDKYNQTYNFPVSKDSIYKWGVGLNGILGMADYHIKENKYDLPYDFLTKTISL